MLEARQVADRLNPGGWIITTDDHPRDAAASAPTGRLDPSTVLGQFRDWLATRPLAARTRSTYAERVGRFCGWLETERDAATADVPALAQVVSDGHALSYAARDWRRHLLTKTKAPPRRSTSPWPRWPPWPSPAGSALCSSTGSTRLDGHRRRWTSRPPARCCGLRSAGVLDVTVR